MKNRPKRVYGTNLKFPLEVELKKMRDRLSDPNYLGTHLPGDRATPIELAKFEICQTILRYMREHELLQKDLAKRLDIDASRTNELVHCRYERFTFDRLFSLLLKIHPNTQIKLVA